MATILKNVLHFTGLVVGVPAPLPHRLNVHEIPTVPQLVIPRTCGYTVTADATNVIVTRTTGAADLDVYVEHWHTIESVTPVAGLGSLVPFITACDGGGAGSPTVERISVGPADPDIDWTIVDSSDTVNIALPAGSVDGFEKTITFLPNDANFTLTPSVGQVATFNGNGGSVTYRWDATGTRWLATAQIGATLT